MSQLTALAVAKSFQNKLIESYCDQGRHFLLGNRAALLQPDGQPIAYAPRISECVMIDIHSGLL